MIDGLDITINIILAMMTIPLALFIYRYARYSPWRSSWQGITLMTQKAAMLSLVLYYLHDAVFPDWVGQRRLLIAILLLLLALFWATLAGLLFVQSREGLVSRRKGTGYVEERDIEQTKPRPGAPTE